MYLELSSELDPQGVLREKKRDKAFSAELPVAEFSHDRGSQAPSATQTLLSGQAEASQAEREPLSKRKTEE